MSEQIESLALAKDFAALNPAERSLVLSEYSEAEFEHLRSVLLAARQLDATALPPAHLRSQLLEKMALQAKPGLVHRVISARIPFWQAAAAFALLGVAIWFLKPEPLREKIVTIVQTRVDTVWQEKILWRDRVVWRERIVIREKTVVEPIAAFPTNTNEQAPASDYAVPEIASPRVGTSLGDTPELMNFFTQGK